MLIASSASAMQPRSDAHADLPIFEETLDLLNTNDLHPGRSEFYDLSLISPFRLLPSDEKDERRKTCRPVGTHPPQPLGSLNSIDLEYSLGVITGVLRRTTIFLTPGQVQRLALVAKRKGLRPAQTPQAGTVAQFPRGMPAVRQRILDAVPLPVQNGKASRR